ncbi:MAG: hypothetical protein ACT4QE_20575, partial [Anaerolineales bacterium]
WAINFIAPVRGHELTTRAELLRTQPDHPRATEQYFKLQLGPLERLPQPIASRKWRRLTFLYTTGERLLGATEINDLIIQNEERELLWKALRERGLAAERGYESAQRGELDFALLCALGKLGVIVQKDGEKKALKERGEWRYVTVSETALKENVVAVAQTIEQEVERLGGLAA